ncbi:MAG: ABC transporter permease [Paracoccaceae bacterium]|nr:ABC transporter permease [Paracoccaceae bacterium]
MSGLAGLIVKRLGLGLLTLLIISIIIFIAMEALPGDTAQQILGQAATEENLAALREELGLNQPLPVRYLAWLTDALRGDFGISVANQREVAEQLGPRFGNTLFLAAFAAIIAVPLAITLGVLAALFRNSIYDRVSNALALVSISSPEFFLGYILVLFFAVQNQFFPPIASVTPGMDFWARVEMTFLPALTMSLVVMAYMMRMTRAAIINLLASPYIEMARLKGVPQRRVITRHALPNALAPIINVVALNLAYLITGVVLVEVVFVYPGVGQLLVDSVSKQDGPVVQACCLIFAATFILFNLIADVGSIVTNPRLRHPK